MKIVFLGDSITDAGCDKENYHDMGHGYAKYATKHTYSCGDARR